MLWNSVTRIALQQALKVRSSTWKGVQISSKLQMHEESHVKLHSVEAFCSKPECMKRIRNAIFSPTTLILPVRYVRRCGKRTSKAISGLMKKEIRHWIKLNVIMKAVFSHFQKNRTFFSM